MALTGPQGRKGLGLLEGEAQRTQGHTEYRAELAVESSLSREPVRGGPQPLSLAMTQQYDPLEGNSSISGSGSVLARPSPLPGKHCLMDRCHRESRDLRDGQILV